MVICGKVQNCLRECCWDVADAYFKRIQRLQYTSWTPFKHMDQLWSQHGYVITSIIKVRDWIFPNFNGAIVKVWKLISNLISHFTGHHCDYLFMLGLNLIHVNKRDPCGCFNTMTVFPDMGIPIMNIRWSWYRLICIAGIPLLVRRHIEMKMEIFKYHCEIINVLKARLHLTTVYLSIKIPLWVNVPRRILDKEHKERDWGRLFRSRIPPHYVRILC